MKKHFCNENVYKEDYFHPRHPMLGGQPHLPQPNTSMFDSKSGLTRLRQLSHASTSTTVGLVLCWHLIGSVLLVRYKQQTLCIRQSHWLVWDQFVRCWTTRTARVNLIFRSWLTIAKQYGWCVEHIGILSHFFGKVVGQIIRRVSTAVAPTSFYMERSDREDVSTTWCISNRKRGNFGNRDS